MSFVAEPLHFSRVIWPKSSLVRLGVLDPKFASTMDCLGLCLEWEQDADIRKRLRAKDRLLTKQPGEEFCQPNRVNAVANACLLRPVLGRIGKSDKHKLPHLEDFKIEVHTLYEKCGVSPGPSMVYSSSVEIKRLVGLVKRRAGRKEVTKERDKKNNMSYNITKKWCNVSHWNCFQRTLFENQT